MWLLQEHKLASQVKHTDMPNEMKTEVVDIIAGWPSISWSSDFAYGNSMAGSIDKFTLPTGVNFEGATRAIKACFHPAGMFGSRMSIIITSF